MFDMPPMKPCARALFVSALALTVAACAGRDGEEPERGERLAVPPDLSADRVGDVPASRSGRTAAMSDEEREELERADRDVAPEPIGVRMRRQGAERWLHVQASPDELWPLLEDWLEDENVPVSRSDQERGMIETAWVSRPMGPAGGAFLPLEHDPASSPLAEQYLIRIEPTDSADESEVFVSHRRVAVQDDGWAPRPVDRGLEVDVLRGFMLHLGADEVFAAQQAGEREQRLTRLDTDADGQPVLLVRDSYLQTWQRLGLAVDRAAFTVEDRSRAQGRFLVRYDPAAEDDDDGPGFFARLAFWREREPELEPGTYAIVVGSGDDGSVVSIRTEDGDAVPERLAERLLALIEDQMR